MQMRTLKETVQRIRDGVVFERSIKEFMDAALMLTDDSGREKLIEEEPGLISTEFEVDPADLYNVLIAGIACEIAHYSELKAPEWTNGEHRSLDEPYFTSPNKEMQKIQLATTPAPYRQRNLFCGKILGESLALVAAK